MSLDTTIEQAFFAADKELRQHYGLCSQCAIAKRRRTLSKMCKDGVNLRNEFLTATTRVNQAKAEDRRPARDQLSLF